VVKSADNTVKLWNPSTSQLIDTLTGHSGYIASVAFNHDGTLLASGSRDGTVLLWDSEYKLTPGDVSGDEKITAYDAHLVLQHVVGLIELSSKQREAADVTGDDNVTALDAALILQYCVGIITEFPREQPGIAPAFW